MPRLLCISLRSLNFSPSCIIFLKSNFISLMTDSYVRVIFVTRLSSHGLINLLLINITSHSSEINLTSWFSFTKGKMQKLSGSGTHEEICRQLVTVSLLWTILWSQETVVRCFSRLFRVSLLIELGASRRFGTGWRVAFGIFVIIRPILLWSVWLQFSNWYGVMGSQPIRLKDENIHS